MSDTEVILQTDYTQLCVPVCDCQAELVEFLAEFNGQIGGIGARGRKIPSVFVQRIDPLGPMPPAILPCFCPFCGTRFERAAPQ
jgi:hypothetical protein